MTFAVTLLRMNLETDTKWLTPSQVAAKLPNVTTRMVQRWANSGLIEAEQLPSKRWRIPARAVESMLTQVGGRRG